MNTKQLITRTTTLFAALTLAGITVAVTAQFVPSVFAQTVLVAIGSAIFGAGLAFFLVRVSAIIDQ